MKNKIFMLYILTVLAVFISVLAWEFWLEPFLGPIVHSDFLTETASEQWEFIKTVLVFCAFALIIPALLTLKIEKKRQEAFDSLDKLQQKTESLLKERTVELATVRNKLKDDPVPQKKSDKITDTTQISLQTLIDSITDTILVIDTGYHVRMLNKAARDLYFSDSQSLENLLCHQLSHNEENPCEGPEHECPFKIVMESGRSCTVIHQHFNKEGEKVPFEIQASPIFDDNGEIIGIVELARNVTKRLAEEQKQKEADARLLDLQRQQSIATLAGGLSHEFNNILTSILGNAELLNVRLPDRDINKKQAEAIIDGSEQLANLTKQLLAYAKGGKYLNQSISINELISNSLHLINTEAFSVKDADLDLADNLWPIQGDPAQVSQLIMNIIINGFEALEGTDGKLTIHTVNITKTEKWRCKLKNIHPPGDYVLFRVTNTGSTISEELMGKIFDPFFSTKFTGRGMGLAAAKGIVENHEGCISVESFSNETSFQVLLPREIPDAEFIDSGRKSSDGLLNLKVLVVDDEPQVLSIIKSLLDHQGCKVLSADKGVEALEVLERHKSDLDLVILDIQMPDMTGDKVYRKLKKIKPDLKVLISSGYEEYTALKNILLDPKDRFIKKPFRMADLILKIKEVMVQD
jgi:PAS domain S-box-containing protein